MFSVDERCLNWEEGHRVSYSSRARDEKLAFIVYTMVKSGKFPFDRRKEKRKYLRTNITTDSIYFENQIVDKQFPYSSSFN